MQTRKVIASLLIGSELAMLTGCRTVSFYGQAIHGQLHILRRQEKISQLLTAPATPAELKKQLRLGLLIRDFAETELHLPAGTSYLRFGDLNRPHVAWNVYGATEFSLEKKTWWYPLVGRLSYRGYFSQQSAERYRQYLRRRGFEVYTEGVDAYSTLGWFSDPILNTFVHYEESWLAEIIFHELAHRRLFVKGDTDFNEAFATAVAREGVRRWLLHRGQSEDYGKYVAHLKRQREFTELVLSARATLAALYETVPPCDSKMKNADESLLRAEKRRIILQLRKDYAALKSGWGGKADYDEWFAGELNNAQLNTIDAYYHLVPAFDRLLRRKAGDLTEFYLAVERLAQLTQENRKRTLTELLAPEPPITLEPR